MQNVGCAVQQLSVTVTHTCAAAGDTVLHTAICCVRILPNVCKQRSWVSVVTGVYWLPCTWTVQGSITGKSNTLPLVHSVHTDSRTYPAPCPVGTMAAFAGELWMCAADTLRMSRISGACSSAPPYVPSWHAQGQIYRYLHLLGNQNFIFIALY